MIINQYYWFTSKTNCAIIVKREQKAHPCCRSSHRPRGGRKMKKYEIMYIIRPTVLEDERVALIEELSNIFTSRGSEVLKKSEWGIRELAYEIEKHKKGYYVVLDVLTSEEARVEFDRVVRIKEDVIRYLILKDER